MKGKKRGRKNEEEEHMKRKSEIMKISKIGIILYVYLSAG